MRSAPQNERHWSEHVSPGYSLQCLGQGTHRHQRKRRSRQNRQCPLIERRHPRGPLRRHSGRHRSAQQGHKKGVEDGTIIRHRQEELQLQSAVILHMDENRQRPTEKLATRDRQSGLPDVPTMRLRTRNSPPHYVQMSRMGHNQSKPNRRKKGLDRAGQPQNGPSQGRYHRRGRGLVRSYFLS